MSALKPPIQKRPGAAPGSLRTAILRSPEGVPKVRKLRQECDIRVSRLAVRADVRRRRMTDRAAPRPAQRWIERVSPQRGPQRKGIGGPNAMRCGRTAMSVAEPMTSKAVRGLPGATVLQILP